MLARQILQNYVTKSSHGHGEGSRGGHIIGHTKSGQPIYAHPSADKKNIKPLTGGNKYGVDHFVHGPPSEDENELSEHLHDNPSFGTGQHGGSVPLSNGHHLVFHTDLLSHSTPSSTVYAERGNPLSYEEDGEPAEYSTMHYIADASGKPVEGAELTEGLKQLANKTNTHLSQRAVDEHDPAAYADDGPDNWDDDR